MFWEIVLTIFVILKPWEQANPVVTQNAYATNISLDKYGNLGLKTDVRQPQTAKMASLKVVSKPTLPKTKAVSSENYLAKVMPKIDSPEYLDPLFEQYSTEYNVSQDLMRKIAKCESNFNPGAVNGPYVGMYQFVASTWVSNRKAMGEDPNLSLRFNPEEAIKTTAFKISRDGTGAWPVCGR